MTDPQANNQWMPSIKSLAIITATVGLLLLVIYFLGPYLGGRLLSPVATPTGSPPVASAAPSSLEIIGAIVAILTIIGAGVLFIFQNLVAQIAELTKRINDVGPQIDEKVKEKLKAQTEGVTERYRQLSSNLDTVEERYPWLTGVKNFEGVINVPSSTALLETIGNVIESDKRNFAYEWFVEASEDDKLRGTPESFMALAVIARVLFGDDLLVDKMLIKCEGAARDSISWRAARVAHYIRIGNLTAAANICLELERRIQKRQLPDFIQNLLGRRAQLPEAIPPEVLATLSLFYKQAGDRYGLTRVLPVVRKKVPAETLELAKKIEQLINPKGPSEVDEDENGDEGLAQSSFITILLKIEIDLMNQLSDLTSDPTAIYAHVDRLYALTGNRQVAKAMQRVLRRVVQDREDLIAFNRSVSSPSATETTEVPRSSTVSSEPARDPSLSAEFTVAEEAPSGTSGSAGGSNGEDDLLTVTDFDPVWNGEWKPDTKPRAAGEPQAVGGYPPERAQLEARERATELLTQEKKNKGRIEEVRRLKEAAEAKQKADGEDPTLSDQVAMRALDVLVVSWKTIDKASSMYAFIESMSPIDRRLKVSADTQAEYAALPWATNISLIRLRDITWRPEKLYVYYLYVNEGEHEGEHFRLKARLGTHSRGQRTIQRCDRGEICGSISALLLLFCSR